MPSWKRSEEAELPAEVRLAVAAVLEEKDRSSGGRRLLWPDCPVMVKLLSSSSSSLPTTMG